ncbi:hypothetical protein MSSIH_1846 [Methanosarcina siciliae HI350]|uniref:Uncharacterized protein n=1 Tax=Methanosarcina siciliae HI350 TaxID=1434119 RepID=A0A0E3LAS6_9EURY|nr:hypothetical protein [Methanosarcina siciliae]AKB32536.1 hypothetical protein MSSIH_1846 [Methanosarcina siciliae HI350]
MVTQGDKAIPMKLKIEVFNNLQVIKDYCLVLGGGKIGTDFLRYALKNGFPFVLIIDRDENAPASREARVLKNRSELINLLREKTKISLREENAEQLPGPEAYFYSMDMHSVPFLLRLGIPENIIPAVPCHAVAYMLADILEFPVQEAETEENPKANLHETAIPEEVPEKKISGEKRPVNELFIRPEDSELLVFFKTLAAVIPGDVTAGSYPEYGMLFFSYAREGEICPDGCPGPRDRCPIFGRDKPRTITEYTGELNKTIQGWVFESHQMKPGVGGLKGGEFKRNILEIMEFVSTLQEERSLKKPEKPEERAFFIATTCTCHGVLNLFYVT